MIVAHYSRTDIFRHYLRTDLQYSESATAKESAEYLSHIRGKISDMNRRPKSAVKREFLLMCKRKCVLMCKLKYKQMYYAKSSPAM